MTLTGNTALKGGWQLYRGSDIGIPGLAFSAPGYSQEFQFPYYNRNAASLMVDHSYGASSWFASSSVKVYWQSEHRNFFSDINVDLTGSPGFPPGPVLYEQTEGPLLLARYVRAARASRFAQVRSLPPDVGPRRLA